jgi:hypothetical protein
MFKLVVALFLLTAPDEPVHVMTYNHSAFESEEVCLAFFGTDDGKAAMGTFKMMGFGSGLKVKFACIEAEDKTI